MIALGLMVLGLCSLAGRILGGATGESAGRSPQSLGWVRSDRAKERLKSLRRDPDRVRDAHVVQFAALAEAVYRGRGHSEPCSHLFDREKRADPNSASHRCPDHERTQNPWEA